MFGDKKKPCLLDIMSVETAYDLISKPHDITAASAIIQTYYLSGRYTSQQIADFSDELVKVIVKRTLDVPKLGDGKIEGDDTDYK